MSLSAKVKFPVSRYPNTDIFGSGDPLFTFEPFNTPVTPLSSDKDHRFSVITHITSGLCNQVCLLINLNSLHTSPGITYLYD